MAANDPTVVRKHVSIATLVIYIVVAILIVTAGTIAGFRLMTEWPAIRGVTSAPQAEPTAIIVPRPTSLPYQPPRDEPAAAPALPGIAQNAATAQALFDAAVKQGESAPVPNVGQSEPVILQSKPADERMPAGDNVPTSEPIQQSGGMFGSKPVLINPQETHTCLHGQVWVDEKGCRNP